ncbi:hypothetical protein ES319_D04G198600v1 [Gossypium barbadense]|uniref:Uncharacterized protein n=1 Tax=Gossypium barbadense TaxID=3634 RepID=A0A5J5RXS3_GOSBA|nr:hypothetical protein ES319_D04G198600v1 [Gossypium barbadense]PPD86357.1 hypothetical protein GOBAR_DD16714 [Gossypium barbadense]
MPTNGVGVSHHVIGSLTENKNERVVCVKNMTPEVILLYATRLRNALGRNVVKLKTGHVTKHPSVQGTWTTNRCEILRHSSTKFFSTLSVCFFIVLCSHDGNFAATFTLWR